MHKSAKILCLLLALLMLQIMSFSLPAAAEETQDSIIIKDPGFEEIDQGWLKNWTHKNTEGATFSVDTAKAHSGKSSIHISSTSDTYSWAAQSGIYGLKPGSVYAVSVFANVDLQSGNGAATFIEYYTESGEYINVIAGSLSDTYPYGMRISNTNGLWQEHVCIFKVPEGAAVAKVYVCLYGTGDAWFDDVSITFSGGPDPFRFDTNRIFHYKETKEGGAYVKLDPYYLGSDTEKAKVDYALLDGETVIAEAENVRFKDLEATFTYSTEGLTSYKPYTVSCKIKDKDENVLEEYTRNVYVVDRPTILDENGDFVIDGKKLNPVIGWDITPADYEKAKEAGINTIIVGPAPGADPRLTIEAIKEAGLYVVVGLFQYPFNAGHPDKINDTIQMLEEWRDVPNVIGYCMQDEPWLVGENLETREHAERAYLLAREMDPARSVFLVDKRFDYITAQYCDTYILDSYAYGANSQVISSESRAAWEATKDKNAFWELGATYWTTSGMPPVNTFRNSIYRAFEEGARGLGCYSFGLGMNGRPGYENREQLYYWEDWESFCTFNKVEVPILYDLFVNGEAIVFNEFDDGNGDNSIKWFDWFVGDDMYLMAHNRSRETQTVKIPLESANGKISVSGFKAEPIGLTTQSEMTGKGSMELTLASEEIALYKITPDSPVDLSRIDEPAEEKTENTETGIFSDLAGYDWAKEAIEVLYEDGIINAKEEGIYAPGEAITRLDFVSALVRALELTEEGEAFPDCDAPEIRIARAAGITNGDTDGNFRPYDTITRQDIMTTAVRALNAGLSETEIPEFSDWSLVSDYALEAVQIMTQAGVIVGNGDGTLNPLGNATRAEAAVMLERMLDTEFAEKPNPDEIREEIEFTGTPDEATLAKWNDAKALTEGLGICAPETLKSVTKGDFETAISNILGTNYDAFAENNKALTYAEAVEALVKLLGYEAYAEARGGIMAMAAQIDLTKGLSPEEYIRGGELCVLLENAIGIKMVERKDYGGSETYQESEDTLLSAYRNIYKHKGIVEEDAYTDKSIKEGKVVLEGEVFTGGEGFLRRHVEAYAEHTDDEKKIVYIRPAGGSEAVMVDVANILEADTARVRYEDANGKEQVLGVSGALLYINGTKKTGWTGADIRPAMGTVTLITNGGAGVDTILVEKYENRVVESVYSDEDTVYFKNGVELVLDKEEERFYMDFALSTLKEWDVLSVMLREDGTPYKVMTSSENVQGAPSETSADGVLLGETVYPVAEGCFGTPALGTEAVFYLDYTGKIAAIDDEGTLRNYGYFTSMEGGKGLAGGVSLRIFTKKGEMVVFRAADNIRLNGEPVTEAQLLSAPVLLEGGTPKGQLIVYELNEKEEVTEITTAIDAENCMNMNAPKEFSKVYTTNGWGGEFAGYALGTFGTLYRVDSNTISFFVPDEYSADPNAYKVTMGKTSYAADKVYQGGQIFDWDSDFTVGALVWTEEVKTEVDALGSQAIFLGLGTALDKDGLPAKALRFLDMDGKERTYYAESDMKVMMDTATLTSLSSPNETQKTVQNGSYIMNSQMPFEALNIGDVVQYEANGTNIGAIRVLFRAKSPKIGEHVDTKKYNGTLDDKKFAGSLVLAYGSVENVFSDGFSMIPDKAERLFLHYSSGNAVRPVFIMDMQRGTYKITSMSAIHKGDMVFVTRTNTYQGLIIVYR